MRAKIGASYDEEQLSLKFINSFVFMFYKKF